MRDVPRTSEGYVHIVYGCMFAGKSTELLRLASHAMHAGQEVRVFKPDIDVRYSRDSVTTHDGQELHATRIPVDQPEMLLRFVENYTLPHVIIIDEGQFFSIKLRDVAKKLALQGVRVLVGALHTDFRGHMWPTTSAIFEVALVHTQLHAVCDMCGKTAHMTQRLIDDKPAPADSPQVLLGETESYEARCLGCHTVPTA